MCIRGKHNGLLNHLNQLLFALKKDTFVDFQLRFVFIAKTFSSNCFKTVTYWEKSHMSQNDFHCSSNIVSPIYQWGIRSFVQKVTQVAKKILIIALSVIAKSWTGSLWKLLSWECPSKTWYIQIMEYYIRKTYTRSIVSTWIDLENTY